MLFQFSEIHPWQYSYCFYGYIVFVGVFLENMLFYMFLYFHLFIDYLFNLLFYSILFYFYYLLLELGTNEFHYMLYYV